METTNKDQLLSKMKAAVKSGEAKVLTLEVAKSIIGITIRTVYFGYNGQDGTDEFAIGRIVSGYDLAKEQPVKGWNSRAEYWESYMNPEQLRREKETFHLMTTYGRDTFICCHNYYEMGPARENFTCSDIDRNVFFTVLK